MTLSSLAAAQIGALGGSIKVMASGGDRFDCFMEAICRV
jgi:hypothetical protein